MQALPWHVEQQHREERFRFSCLWVTGAISAAPHFPLKVNAKTAQGNDVAPKVGTRRGLSAIFR
jgi:hypothetical protein